MTNITPVLDEIGIDTAPNAREVSVDYWKSLYYFNLYRLVLSGGLLTLAWAKNRVGEIGAHWPELFMAAALGLAVMSVLNLITITRGKPSFHTQAHIQISADIVLVTLMMHASGGVSSGLGLLMIVSVAASGVVLPGRVTLFFAALATLFSLGEHSYSVLLGNAYHGTFTQIGLQGIGLFTTGFILFFIARRTRTTEELAETQAQYLASLGQINQLVVQQLETGVLVVSDQGQLRLANHTARELLGIHDENLPSVVDQIPKLSDDLERLTQGETLPPRTFKLGPKSIQINSRIIALSAGKFGGALIFLVDASAVEKEVQQLKLAALGRLTAAIAHEIRNPLGAVSHAAQLLAESQSIKGEDDRLVDIVKSQSQRIDQIVESILTLGKRGSRKPIDIPLKKWLEQFVKEFCDSESIPAGALEIIGPELTINFNPEHLSQVVGNLCRNALRHSPSFTGEALVKLEIKTSPGHTRVQLDIVDHGEGVAVENVHRLFEPFFTTEAKGIGLGLYVSREFCGANQAELDYLPEPDGGSRFRISFNQNLISTQT